MAKARKKTSPDDEMIIVRGARQHNLKNITLSIPRDKLVVITGLSGSGKSSLAFDTLYAEGQRRYVESLSAYARQFLDQMERPDVDAIEGLPPTIAIEQSRRTANPRSTVATSTEIHDYLRVLFARVGTPYCPKCGKPIRRQRADDIVTSIMRLKSGTRLMVLAPLVRGQRGEHREVLRRVVSEGFVRVRVDGRMYEVTEVPPLVRSRRHTIEVVVDRVVARETARSRLAGSVEVALRLSDGLVIISHERASGTWTEKLYSELYACPTCGVNFEELTPRMFSFNSPYGACKRCNGLGTRLEFDEELIVPDSGLALGKGAIAPWRKSSSRRFKHLYEEAIERFGRDFKIDLATPYRRLSAAKRKILLRGTKATDAAKFKASWEGIIPSLKMQFEETRSRASKERLLTYMTEQTCPTCRGARLRPEPLAVRIDGKSIHDITAMSISAAGGFFTDLRLKGDKRIIGRQVVHEIRQRLGFMEEVGIGYITLDRSSATLSGGESQRVRLATQVGSGLVGVCYVLDEPTIGLHARDNYKLLATLKDLRDLGNTVIVVEHDEDTIREADYLLDMGPGAGASGGWIVAGGSVDEVLKNPRSLTAQYLTGGLCIPVPKKRRPVRKRHSIVVRGARENNLKNIVARIPLGVFVCVTGVSGSGKSTLVDQTLVRAICRRLYGSRDRPGAHSALLGADKIDRVIEIDQSPIGRTPRSNPATYTGLWNGVRRVFASTREARVRGYRNGRFSFNVKGGRCESCAGQGVRKLQMHFLPDVFVTCQSCKGARFNRETLQITYRGKTIADILAMRVDEALEFFENFPQISQKLGTLHDVGLGYITLGQNSTMLSGGEAQRVKLSAELSKRSTGRTLYVLDEPTMGLHFADVQNLLNVLNRLTDLGNTVLVIEHNFEIIKSADWIIDLGPEGGDAGGQIVAEGRPEDVAKVEGSHTGQLLARRLGR